MLVPDVPPYLRMPHVLEMTLANYRALVKKGSYPLEIRMNPRTFDYITGELTFKHWTCACILFNAQVIPDSDLPIGVVKENE